MTNSPSAGEGGNSVRFSIRAARVITGVTFEGLDFAVEGASPEEAERLITHFWDHVKECGATVKPSGSQHSMQSVAERIRTEMDKRGWSQAELARKSDVTPSVISNLLSGRGGISPANRKLVFEALGFE